MKTNEKYIYNNQKLICEVINMLENMLNEYYNMKPIKIFKHRYNYWKKCVDLINYKIFELYNLLELEIDRKKNH